MCGRFQLSVSGKKISERFNVELFQEMFTPRYNCAPSQYLPVITNEKQKIVQLYRWGLIPDWARDANIGNRLINARSESLMEKVSFKQSFIRRRCLIPANGFYEWDKSKKKIPYRFYLKGEKLFAMAGLWNGWKSSNGLTIHSFTIITTQPNSLVKTIHSRMPVILQREHEKNWLEEKDPQQLKKMMKPYADKEMESYAISYKINAPINEGLEIIKPVLEKYNQQQLF